MTCEEFFLLLPKDRVRRCGATSNWVVKSAAVDEVVIESYLGNRFSITPLMCQDWGVIPRPSLVPKVKRNEAPQATTQD